MKAIRRMFLLTGAGLVMLGWLTGCDGFVSPGGDSPEETASTAAENSTRESALELEPGSTVSGELTSESTELWYVFTTSNADAWDVIRTSVTNVASTLRPKIVIRDEAGNVIVNYPEYSPLDAGANVVRDFSTAGGRYFLTVSSHWSSRGTFSLTVANQGANDAFAGNDTRETAHDLGVLPSGNLQGVLVGAPDRDGNIEEDWFKFTTENDGLWDQVRFEISEVGSGFRPHLKLVNENGDELFSVPQYTPFDPGAGFSHNLGTQGGTYYLRVSNHYSTYGTYSLRIENRAMIDAYEPNETRATAHDLGEIPLAGSISATIAIGSSNGDTDWFRFTLPQNNSDDFTVSVTNPADDLRVALRIEDEPGNGYYGSASAKGVAYSLNTADTSSISPVGGNTYYVRVRGHASNDFGDYELMITQ